MLFSISTGNSIIFSSYVLRAATLNAQDGSWLNRGIAVGAITVVCLIHAFAPRWGIWLSNGFGAFKLVLLSLLVFTGFAALAGNTAAPRPNPSNFSSFSGPSWKREGEVDSTEGVAGGFALALLQILYSYSGWENANYVRGHAGWGWTKRCDADVVTGSDRSPESAKDAEEGCAGGHLGRDCPLSAGQCLLCE